MSKLELKRIHHTFTGKKQRVPVLTDVTLHVNEGEFVSIIGPSGSGKSTLFHIIGGLITPSSGEVWLDGSNVTGTKGLISYMPQQPALFPWRSIEANVALSQEVAGETRTAALEKAREWLPKVGLGGYENELPHVLSGGMQQRVSFLRALLSPQEVMCLDEPFGSLDALTRQAMQSWLLNIWEQNKRSILFVTHSIEEALFLSDRIYVLSNKPAQVIEELVVPFERPRQENVMMEPKFHELRLHVQGLLRQEMML
ncbi:ATP-binding cassette domain-containing protein [Paenibacillus aceris]|uniref:ABC-type nitrate/sulfonate/bicarbonate transport system ATPase subunit n=1 Tax=Paenibacillus aceris TaxID=869555 RepID=A0ABS4HSQ7_9BACL|nr:ABC-type nitrate/sulfonate/bicarbonate transport system ATPase subunit [Paenibacillus aceris]NHW34479.1 ABC transporter ATP-binding protein [Paenibacillus aceris]